MKSKELKAGAFVSWSLEHAYIFVIYRDGQYKVSAELSAVNHETGVLWCYTNCTKLFPTLKAAKDHIDACKKAAMAAATINPLIASFLRDDQYDVWGTVVNESWLMCDYCAYHDLAYLADFGYGGGCDSDHTEWERLDDYKNATKEQRAEYQQFLLKRIESAKSCGMDY